MSRMNIAFLLPLSACFSTFHPDDDDWMTKTYEVTQTESSACTEACKTSCDKIDSRSQYEACVSECGASCSSGAAAVTQKDCTRPAPTGATGTTGSPATPTPPKASICQPCGKNADCAGTGTLCLAIDATTKLGHCGQQCVIDCDCPTGYQCHPVTDPLTGRYDSTLGRQCAPETGKCPECWADKDCGGGKICESGACVSGCVNAADCGMGLRCFEDARCAKPCCFDSDCGNGKTCSNGKCGA